MVLLLAAENLKFQQSPEKCHVSKLRNICDINDFTLEIDYSWFHHKKQCQKFFYWSNINEIVSDRKIVTFLNFYYGCFMDSNIQFFFYSLAYVV